MVIYFDIICLGNGILLVGLVNGTMLIRSATMQLLIRLERYHTGTIWSISNCGPFIATGSDEGRLIVWDIESDMNDPS